MFSFLAPYISPYNNFFQFVVISKNCLLNVTVILFQN